MTIDESLALLILPEATTRRWVEQLHEPHRHYHTLNHVKEMLHHYDGARWEVVAAIWLHDIVYDPRASDNEERSAAQARADLPPSAGIDLVLRIILDSKHHKGGDPLTDAFNDLDLGIIGSRAESYDRYAEQIRREYAFVPDEIYRPARAGILRGFNERQIFKTAAFRHLEAQAHLNLEREIAGLEKRD
jgi:predicted metal-dependent HD superfamily phosphohydrolase